MSTSLRRVKTLTIIHPKPQSEEYLIEEGEEYLIERVKTFTRR